MATATLRLISALRETARNLENPAVTYKWSHYAHCNCGHLVQTVTGLDAEGIQQRALCREGDWAMQARDHANTIGLPAWHPRPDYGDRPALDEGAWEPENVGACVVTGTPLDLVFDQLEAIGLDATDIQHLERLSDPKIRRRLGTNAVDYPHHLRENTIAYLRAWADLLEEELGEEGTPFDAAASQAPAAIDNAKAADQDEKAA
jgi:hypothetical protein